MDETDIYHIRKKYWRTSLAFFRFLGFSLCFLFTFSPDFGRSHDTLYVCEPGEMVQLQVDTSFAGYRWFPTNDLSNPTIADPVVQPFVTITYVVESIGSSGPNLIVNGDLSAGNQGFTSAYVYSPGANPTQGVYGIFPNANSLSPNFFSPCRDHTDGQGNLMAVDGFRRPMLRSGVRPLRYRRIRPMVFLPGWTSIYPPNPARLQFSINGLTLAQPFSAGNEVCQWRQFYATWDSGESTEAQICIINQNTDPNGNDFALDDFAFFQLGEVAYDTITIVVENISPIRIDTTVCAGSSVEYNGTMVAAGTSESFLFTSIHGCDSLVELDVGVLDTIFEYIWSTPFVRETSLIFSDIPLFRIRSFVKPFPFLHPVILPIV